ncbi:type I-C CRISPR-associated protein Cas5c [Ileibacterium valens]|uniref:type I-C CRISPR-associated protein Cas5c n=1 Tax=Ileibacterium valens TaxID=1862668 RepID=UPI00259B0F18|nr:type I-C CRISPR-associated protein Cas5c [Ileibacterium valens]
MSYGIRIRLFGDYALFSRPELKAERYSYDVITPSAAVGVLESIFWHFGLKYHIDKITVINRTERVSVKRNEIKSKISAAKIRTHIKSKKRKDLNNILLYSNTEINQRNSSLLKNVEYIVEAHFEMTDKANPGDNEGKFIEMFKRRARKGQCFRQPYFGCKEFPCYFELLEKSERVDSYYSDVDEIDLGIMLKRIDYSNDEITPVFYHPIMRNGVITVEESEELL